MRRLKRITKGLYKSMPLLISAAALVVLLIVFSALKSNSDIAEWITTNISQYIVTVFGSITSFLPFSLLEMLAVSAFFIAILLIVYGIIFLIKKRYMLVFRGFLIVLVTILGIINVYTLAAGFSYNRDPVPLPMSAQPYMNEQVDQIGQYFIDDYNYCSSQMARDGDGNVVSPYDRWELAKVLQKEFERLDDPYFFKFTAKVKPFFNSWLFSDMGFSGMAFLPTGEAHYNTMTPPSMLPQTMAHEIAHTKGIMREDEANLVSYYILISSDDPYLRYCGYFTSIDYLQQAVILGNNYNAESAARIFSQLPEKAKAEKIRAIKFWVDYKGPVKFLSDALEDLGDFMNDIYLKLQGQSKGTDSYIIPPGQIIEDIDPDTQQPVFTPVYSPIQKIYFAVYENNN